MPCTQALLLRLERDHVDLQMGWSLGNYDDDESKSAQGQSFYILGLAEDIHSMKDDQLEEEENEDDEG